MTRDEVYDEMEHRMALAHQPTNPKPARKEWTLLDRASGGSVVLVGSEDGRVFLLIPARGQWRDDDFRTPANLDKASEGASKWTEKWRDSFDTARETPLAYDSDKARWYAGEGKTVQPKEGKRPRAALNQTEFDRQMDAFARNVVTGVDLADADAVTERFAQVLKLVGAWNYDRAWLEKGLGIWGGE